MSEFMNVPTTFKEAPKNKEGEVTGPQEFKVSNADYAKILDEKGVTKEVLETVRTAENDILSNASKFLADQVKATKQRARLTLGTPSNGQMIVEVGGKEDGKPAPGDKSGKPVPAKFGKVSVKFKRSIPAALKAGVLAEVQSDIEKALK